jgi:RNA polymerase sigma factor (sigma-70 family)
MDNDRPLDDHPLVSSAVASNVQAARRGETAAFTALVREFHGVVLHQAQRMLRDPNDAQDCAQEAFAEAFSTLSRLKEPLAFPGWLRSIVRHRCLRRLRRRDLQLVPLGSEIDTLVPDLAGAERERFLEQWALAGQLIDALPPLERDVTTLFYLKQCSQLEIATFLELPPSTVNNRLHQARERLVQFGEIMTATTTTPTSSRDADRVSRVGTIIQVDGPVIDVRFDPAAALDLFDPLAIAGPNGKTDERMLIVQRRDDGVARCLATSHHEGLRVGMSVLDTNPLSSGLSPFRTGVPAVPHDNLLRALEILAPRRDAAPRLLETGIKAIDLLCPLPEQGSIAQVATALVGRVVLLDELRERLQGSAARLACFCMVDKTEPDTYRGRLPAELNADVPALQRYWVLSAEPAEPASPSLAGCDALIYHSPLLAFQGLYPSIDAERSWSKLITTKQLAAEHLTVAQRARQALLEAKQAFSDAVGLELIACRAYRSAARHLETLAERVLANAPLELVRAYKLQLFLTQPFETARDFTGWPGCRVSLAETLAGTRAILDGAADDLPAAAFRYRGSLEDVRAHASESRQYGKRN